MQLDEQRIKQVYEYFDKIAYSRCSDWITEMRRSLAIIMTEQGISSGKIAKVLHVSHCLISHYKNRMKVRPDVNSVVSEKMWEWIDAGLYPMPGRNNRKQNYTYYLTDTPNKKRFYVSEKKKSKSLDKFIDEL